MDFVCWNVQLEEFPQLMLAGRLPLEKGARAVRYNQSLVKAEFRDSLNDSGIDAVQELLWVMNLVLGQDAHDNLLEGWCALRPRVPVLPVI
jgi:hypothetical protein